MRWKTNSWFWKSLSITFYRMFLLTVIYHFISIRLTVSFAETIIHRKKDITNLSIKTLHSRSTVLYCSWWWKLSYHPLQLSKALTTNILSKYTSQNQYVFVKIQTTLSIKVEIIPVSTLLHIPEENWNININQILKLNVLQSISVVCLSITKFS